MVRAASLLALLLALSAPAATVRYKGYTFEARVVDGKGRRMSESRAHGHPTLYVDDGDQYSVVLRNPLPVRVGVALTIDGLNSIDGERTTPSEASKWIVEPHGSITIRGWQTGSDKLRRFVFTCQDDSYAEWKETRDKASYTRNLGVIGVAWFWSQEELDWVLRPPQPFAEHGCAEDAVKSSPAPSCKRQRSAEGAAEKERAGTGMGHKEDHSVRKVNFEFDTGMYGADDVLAIYYEFARPRPTPKPFLDRSPDTNDGFAPDMHSSHHREPWWIWW